MSWCSLGSAWRILWIAKSLFSSWTIPWIKNKIRVYIFFFLWNVKMNYPYPPSIIYSSVLLKWRWIDNITKNTIIIISWTLTIFKAKVKKISFLLLSQCFNCCAPHPHFSSLPHWITLGEFQTIISLKVLVSEFIIIVIVSSVPGTQWKQTKQ